MKTMSAQEFNQHADEAQREARHAPVVVTRQGRPTLVLLNYEEYQKLAGKPKTALEALTADADLADALENIEFEIPPRSTAQRSVVDFGE